MTNNATLPQSVLNNRYNAICYHPTESVRHRAVEMLSVVAPLMINNVIVNYERCYSP